MDKPTKSFLTNLTYKINSAAIEVHRSLGPGLLESVYQICMNYELNSRNIKFVSEMFVPVYYKELLMDTQLRCDLFVEDCIVVEIKAVNEILPIHKAQLLTYMKLLKAPKGILLNFNSKNLFYEGQSTHVNSFFTNLDEG